MSRIIQFLRQTRLLPLVAAAAALCLFSILPVRAGSYTYSSRQRTVNAGVLVTGTAASPIPDPTPYVFYLLNQRAEVKPFGWNIVNPRAPSAVTQEIKTRWSGYAVGHPVYPYMAAYWEVSLEDVSAEQLKQYDVLYLSFSGVGIRAVDNEKLRRFVDGGGTLLVDYNTGATNLPPFGLFTNAQFTPGSAALGLPPAGAGLTLRHPLITRPFFLGADDILTLGIPALSGGLLPAAGGDFGNLVAPVITHPGSVAVSAAALGAGQIVASALNIGGAINDTSGPNGNAGPYFGAPGTAYDTNPIYSYAPASDLRFLANVISLSDIHPTESKSGHQNASGNDLPSFAPAWNYPLNSAGTNPPPGAAVWGGFVFVRDAAGQLHAFDAFPQEDLTGTGIPDDGSPDFSQGKAYDEIWSTAVGTSASAPTVGVFGGVPSVFVEDAQGNVLQFDPVTGAPRQTLKPSSPSAFSNNAPAPTVYGGRVYAGQSNGNLLVYDSNGSSASGGVLVPTGGTEPTMAAPTVGLIPDGTANDIVALVPTNQNIYTVLLGARGDLLTPHVTAGVTDGYSISNKFRLGSLVPDANSQPKSVAFNDSGGFDYATSSTQPNFVGLLGGAVYGNWDVDFKNSLSPPPATGTLSLNQISGASYGAVINQVAFSAAFSPAAMDRIGDFYYTDNAHGFSYLVGVHDSVQFQNIQMKWRFRLPTGAESITDADGVVYDNYRGFQFVGAPVVDSQGYVYAVATSGNSAAVFCFVANGDIYADGITGFDPNSATFQQPDEFNPGTPNTLRPGPIDATLKYGQFTAAGSRATFFNFGIGAGGIRQLAGNLTEPQPVSVIPPLDAASGTTGTPATIPLHTNLAWVTTTFAVNGGIYGLTKVGDALFLSDGGSLYKLPANPTVGSAKTVTVVNNTGVLRFTPSVGITVTPLSSPVGAVAAAPSVGQGALILNGASGISALTEQETLIADNNRILETDSDGNALWAVDSTNRSIPASAASSPAITKVGFNHPTSLSAVTANDYLVADTGNNRCVRFDRAGDVLWELTRFNDSNNLLSAGSPTTISQPASVQMRREVVSGNILEHYLIADSGNYRVIEVTDTFDANGVLTSDHVLTFVTHTYDKDGRHFRYGSATYFNTPLGLRVAALVTNSRVALNAAGTTLGPVSGDAPGGSILLFDAAPLSPTFGAVTAGFTSFQAGGATYPMRNPRFLSLYTPPSVGVLPFSFLYADDNGAFDLSFVGGVFTTTPGSPTTSGSLAFGKADYQNMKTPPPFPVPMPINNGIVPNRAGLPFVPTCIQLIGTTTINNVITPRYLITQAHSQGELGNPGSNQIGGEIFEVDGINTAVGTYSGGTLSRPTGTGPLTQPSFAIRP